MTAHRIGWLWSTAVVAVLLAIGAVVHAVPSDVQVPNAGNALLFIRDESVPVRMDRPLVLFCFVNANAQPTQHNWSKDDLLDNLVFSTDRPFRLPDRPLVAGPSTGALLRGEFRLTELPINVITSTQLPAAYRDQLTIPEHLFLQRKVEKFEREVKRSFVEGMESEEGRQVVEALYRDFHIKRIFRLEIAIPNSFASYFHPKIRVIVRDRTTDPSTTFISARSTPVYGETGLINVARAADKLEDFREKLDRLNEQMRGVYTGVNQGLEAVGQHKHESWFPKQLQKWVPDVPPKTEQQQLTESAVPMSYKDAIMRSQSTRDTTA